MSLVDSDKDNVQRKSPGVNAPDTVINRMSHKTSQFTYRESGSAVTSRTVAIQGGFMWVDDENRVSAVFAYIPEASPIPVLAIMKENLDVFADGYGGTIDRPRV